MRWRRTEADDPVRENKAEKSREENKTEIRAENKAQAFGQRKAGMQKYRFRKDGYRNLSFMIYRMDLSGQTLSAANCKI